MTLTDGSLSDGTLSSGARTVFNGTVGANLTGSGGLVKDGAGTVVLCGKNSYSGGTTVLAGTLIVNSSDSLPDGSSLTIGAGAEPSSFDPSQTASSISAHYGLAAASSPIVDHIRCDPRTSPRTR